MIAPALQFLQANVTNSTLPSLPTITLANAFGDVTSILILLTLMIAMTIRTSSEYVEAVIKGEATSFNRKYLATALIAFFTAAPFAIALMPEATKVFLAYFGEWGVAGALFMVGVLGYGWNHAVNKGTSLIGHFFTSNKEPETEILPTKTEDKTETPA